MTRDQEPAESRVLPFAPASSGAAARRLRIAFFIEGMSASGVDTSTQLLAQGLRALGHEVVHFVPWKSHATAQNRDTLVRVAAVRVSASQPVYWSVPVSWSTYERFRREHFDLVHVHTSTVVNLLAWQVRAAQRLPLVYTYHTMSADYAHYLGPLAGALGGVVHPAITLFDRMICNQADAIVAPSPKAQRYLAQIEVRPPVVVIPNGIDMRCFQPRADVYLQERLGVGPERRILLFVGRLNQEKRPLLAYDCFRRIHAARPEALLVMVGVGALQGELEQRIAADGLQDSVRLTGAIPYAEMPRVYNSAHLWISTSMSEVHPMVALEAAAGGLPAVAWNDSALEGVVLPERTGRIVDSADAFVAAACALLESETLRRRMGQAAAAHARRFNMEATATRMAALYQALCAPRRSGLAWLPPDEPIQREERPAA